MPNKGQKRCACGAWFYESSAGADRARCVVCSPKPSPSALAQSAPVPTWIVIVRVEVEHTIEIPAPDASIAEVIAESYSAARVAALATHTREPQTYAGAARRKEPEPDQASIARATCRYCGRPIGLSSFGCDC